MASKQQKKRLKVFITDDHVSVREGLKAILEHNAFIVVGVSETPGDTLERAFRRKPDVLVLDLNMGNTRGTEMVEMVLEKYPDAKIVVYSMRETMGTITAAYESGAKAYVTKSSDPKILVDAINKVASDEVYFMPGYAEQIALYHTSGKKSFDPRRVLSRRELDIFILLAEGKNPAEIAQEFGVTAKSIANRSITIRHKLGINRNEFTQVAVQYNLVTDHV